MVLHKPRITNQSNQLWSKKSNQVRPQAATSDPTERERNTQINGGEQILARLYYPLRCTGVSGRLFHQHYIPALLSGLVKPTVEYNSAKESVKSELVKPSVESAPRGRTITESRQPNPETRNQARVVGRFNDTDVKLLYCHKCADTARPSCYQNKPHQRQIQVVLSKKRHKS